MGKQMPPKVWDGAEWIGRRVKIKGYKKWGKVRAAYDDVEGGIILEDAVGGLRSWNVQDVEKWKPED